MMCFAAAAEKGSGGGGANTGIGIDVGRGASHGGNNSAETGNTTGAVELLAAPYQRPGRSGR